MNRGALVVYREYLGCFEEAGHLASSDEGVVFAYSESYLQNETAHAISQALPLQVEAFSPRETESFFEGILPEGRMRRNLSRTFHADVNDTSALLARLNNESAGALVFKEEGEEPDEDRGYIPLTADDFEHFAQYPREFSLQAASRSRLSLAGAQMKVGLFFDDCSNTWMYPEGTAPSSHIIKASDGSFLGQTVNEAICMETAAMLGFETAACHLISLADLEPLIAIKRFDRLDVGDEFLHRLHQEDFLQALPEFFDKYEPTDGNYAHHCARIINERSQNPVGDKRFLFSRLLFDWAIGNADNHLKNHSMLWHEDWSAQEISPLYDVTCTTIYPEIDREMGVSFGRSRRIDNVTREDIMTIARLCGVGEKFAGAELQTLLEEFPTVLEKAVMSIVEQGFPQAESLGERIRDSFIERRGRLDK